MHAMGRSVARIQAEIDLIETRLASEESLIASGGSDGTSLSNADRASLAKRLDQLYTHLDRANESAPMFLRGRVGGLRDF